MADITINEALGTVDLAGMDDAGRAAAQQAVKQASGLSRDKLIAEIDRLRGQLPGVRGVAPTPGSPESANRVRIQVFAAALAKELGQSLVAPESKRVDLIDSLAYDTDLKAAAYKVDHPPVAPVPTTVPEQTLTGLPADTAAAVSGANADVYKPATGLVQPTTEGTYHRPAALSNDDIQYLFNVGQLGDINDLANVANAERVKKWRAQNPGKSTDEMPTDLRAIENPMGVRLYYDQTPRAGSDVFGPPGSTPTQFVGHGRVDTLAQSTVERTKSIRETLNFLNTLGDPAKVKAMQQHLVAGGFLDANAVKQNRVAWGDPNDTFTQEAWHNLIRSSLNDRTKSMMDILQQRESALGPHLAEILDPNGGGGTSVTISLTDPAAVRVMSNQLSQNLIGRKLDEVEQAQLVQQIHDMELKQGMGRAGKGNKVVNQVDPQAELTEAIRAHHPTEAGAADVANEFTMFNRLVKGTLPSEGGF